MYVYVTKHFYDNRFVYNFQYIHLYMHTHLHYKSLLFTTMAKHVTAYLQFIHLVHTDGFRPLCPTVDVPELKPGERVELIAKFPPITDVSVDSIKR